MQITGLGMEAKINSVSVVSDDIFSSRVLGVAPPHQLLHLVNVEGSHNLWEGQVLRDRSWNTNLTKFYL